jgi:hypothetical protein
VYLHGKTWLPLKGFLNEIFIAVYFFEYLLRNIDSWTQHFCSIVVNDQQNASRSQWIFIDIFQVYPNMFRQMVATSGALEAAQVISVLWVYTDYDPSSVARFHDNWPHWTL